MPPEPRRALVLAICCASIVVVVMDISIVNIAVPAIRADLHASTSGLQWTIDAYTLVLAGFLLLAGSSADRFGRKLIFQIGLAVFGLGSLLCSLAPDIGWLVAARALQAVGGTMLNPVAMAIVATTFPEPAERAKAIGVFGSMSGLALVLGPVLGGTLVDSFGWRAVFWINVPIVLVALACTAVFVPESRAERARRFDPVGQVLVVVALGSVVAALIESRDAGWASPTIVGLLALAVAASIGVVAYEPRRTDPLLELRMFASPQFSSAILVALFALCGFGAFLFVTMQYLQDDRGLSAFAAGIALLPVGFAVLILAPITGRFVGRNGPRLPLVIAGVALAAGGASALLFGPATLVTVVLFGVFLATVNPPITNSAVAAMPRSMAGLAASVASSSRQTGTTLGVAIAGSVAGIWWVVLGLGFGIVVLAIAGSVTIRGPRDLLPARRAAVRVGSDGAGR